MKRGEGSKAHIVPVAAGGYYVTVWGQKAWVLVGRIADMRDGWADRLNELSGWAFIGKRLSGLSTHK